MQLSLPELGQFLTLVIISIALGMDAFSIGVGIGIKQLKWQRNLLFAILVGVFHILMPLIGYMMGKVIGGWLEEVAVIIGGCLLCLLGLQMIYKCVRVEETSFEEESLTFVGLLLFAISVSMDSLSVGLSLGLFQVNYLLAVSMFGFTGFFLSGVGLSVGKILGNMIGGYGEMVGGIILIALGMKFIW